MSPGHSGSTLLDLILGSHSTGFSLGEIGSLPKKMDGRSLPDSVCGICEDICPVWDPPEIRRILERYFRWSVSPLRPLRNIAARFGAARGDLYGEVLHRTGAEMAVDSGKRPSWIRRQLRFGWQWRRRRAHLVFLHRDGRAVVNSLLRKYPDRGAETVSRGWMSSIEAMERFYESFAAADRSRVAYEDLAASPRKTFEALCERIGIEFEPAMLAYWSHDHHIVHGNAGTRSLIHRYRQSTPTGGDDNDFYHQVGLAIRLDLRWHEELDPAALDTFERVAGKVNRRYAREGER